MNYYYDANITSVADYYPFGSLMPGRYSGGAGYRFGFNSMEKDDELYGVTGSSYDFGARMYDPRIGRMLKTDPMEKVYPSYSPYSYALNNPVNAVDPDGNLVIFINGMHGGDGGSMKYWGSYAKRVADKIGDYSLRFVDGASGGVNNTLKTAKSGAVTGFIKSGSAYGALYGASLGVMGYSNVNVVNRISAGKAMGLEQAADIISNLSEGESIKIVAHSMGIAYSRGYVAGLKEAAAKMGVEINIEFEVDIAAFQGDVLPAQNDMVGTTYNKTGGLDGGGSNLLKAGVGNSVPGVAPVPNSINITTTEEQGVGHSIKGFGVKGIPESNNNNSKGSEGIPIVKE